MAATAAGGRRAGGSGRGEFLSAVGAAQRHPSWCDSGCAPCCARTGCLARFAQEAEAVPPAVLAGDSPPPGTASGQAGRGAGGRRGLGGLEADRATAGRTVPLSALETARVARAGARGTPRAGSNELTESRASGLGRGKGGTVGQRGRADGDFRGPARVRPPILMAEARRVQ